VEVRASDAGCYMSRLTTRTAIVLAGAMLATSFQAAAQPTNQTVKTVGVLVPGRLDAQNEFHVFPNTLRKLGYREGGNLRFLVKEAGGNLDRLPLLARELVDARVHVIVAVNTPGSQAAINATREIPIVLTQVGDPVGSGLVANLARPGGNVTGVSNMIVRVAPKRLEILKEAVPSAKRIAVLFNPGDPVTSIQVRDVQSSAASLAVEVRFFPVSDLRELRVTFTQINAWQAHAGMWLVGQQHLFQAMAIKLAGQHKLPLMVGSQSDVVSGGLISYAADLAEIYQRTAAQVDRILKGMNPGDLPVEQATRFKLAINIKTAKTLGMTIPSSLLLRADAIVE
jgi:putative tryptophan/tyrosine transport system substrate-binding protein